MIVAGTPKHVGGCTLAAAIPEQAIIAVVRTLTNPAAAIDLGRRPDPADPAAFEWFATYVWCCAVVASYPSVTISSLNITKRIRSRATPSIVLQWITDPSPGLR
ncbi:hypothetical protein [Nonomuraea turkmeniaca]|uniref:hypothetical protein n=1 Tax=Nonomuraea turkmeniaca TaxID=103838 RepID=UPI00147691D8|nr:hypothetical protein [Nonomuraea turkmeniaca]